MSGPVARAVRGSYLAAAVRAGVQALPPEQRRHIADSIRTEFQDSLDLDEATRARHPHDPRWDCLLGHARSAKVIAIETHSAETLEVSLVIKKRAASRQHLRDQLARDHEVAAWNWAASGRVDFVPHERVMCLLSQHGIQFVGGRLEARHLTPLAREAGSPRRGRGSRKPRR